MLEEGFLMYACVCIKRVYISVWSVYNSWIVMLDAWMMLYV